MPYIQMKCAPWMEHKQFSMYSFTKKSVCAYVNPPPSFGEYVFVYKASVYMWKRISFSYMCVVKDFPDGPKINSYILFTKKIANNNEFITIE
mmetsp:Transcript_48929/g.73976  ORF Transcript_48929/g.73976 Transcript_48929/m.73976 type:complete len:92 (+) Transcript_48929:257-532(+)